MVHTVAYSPYPILRQVTSVRVSAHHAAIHSPLALTRCTQAHRSNVSFRHNHDHELRGKYAHGGGAPSAKLMHDDQRGILNPE